MNFRVFATATLALSLFLTGCPGPKSDDPAPEERVIFVKGDPNELIEGASTIKTSPVTEKSYSDWNKMSLVAITQFVEKEVLVNTGVNLKRENEAKDTSGRSETQSAAVEVELNGANGLNLYLLDHHLTLKFERQDDGQFQPKRVVSGSGEEPVELVHWSQSQVGNYTSLLVRATDDLGGRALVAFYFAKQRPSKPIPQTDKRFVYIAGPGQKVGWNSVSGLEVNLCGSPSYASMAKSAIEKWAGVLDGRLSIKHTQTDFYLPFSDLNQRCIFLINSYLVEGRNGVATFGVTYVTTSLSQAEIIDSDVFIFKSELNKLIASGQRAGRSSIEIAQRYTKMLDITFVHELGHLLGLHHKFDGTKSIMSYDLDSSNLQTYDIEAIQELYPKR